jgi:H+-transporting ATPase
MATQIVAVAICMLGVGVRAIPLSVIVAVWIYCLIWMVLLDLLKLAFLRIIAARDRGMASQRLSLFG